MSYHVPQHKLPQTLQEANTLDSYRSERLKAYSQYLLQKKQFQESQVFLTKEKTQ